MCIGSVRVLVWPSPKSQWSLGRDAEVACAATSLNPTRIRGRSLSARGTSPATSTVYSRGCLTPTAGSRADGLGVERLGRDRLGLWRPGRFPGGHHAGVGSGGRMDVLELVLSRGQVHLALEPSVADGSVPAGGGDDLAAIDQAGSSQSWLDVKKR